MLAALPLLKHAYGHLVENKARLGFNHIDKFDFLEAYPLAHAGTFKADTIKNSFAAAGLLPFNPDKVLEQLNIQLRTPTPPDSQSTNSAPKTPYNCKQLEKQMAIKEGFSIQEGQDLLQSENQADEVASTAPAEPAPEAEKHSIYAPPWCSDCHIIGHR